MSAGAGRIMRSIAAAVEAEPAKAFLVEDLCRIAYPELPHHEKKHRVAITRALRRLVENDTSLVLERGFRLGSAGLPLLILFKRQNIAGLIPQLRERKIWLAAGQERF